MYVCITLIPLFMYASKPLQSYFLEVHRNRGTGVYIYILIAVPSHTCRIHVLSKES